MIPEDIKLLIDITNGDGSIWVDRNRYRFRVEHSIKQLEYVQYKEWLLKEQGYKITSRRYFSQNPRTLGFEYYRVDINNNDPRLHTVHKYIYNKGRKSIDNHLLRVLDVRSLAFWFMDDGNAKTTSYILEKDTKVEYSIRKTGSYKLSLARYTQEEANMVANWLLTVFNIESIVSLYKIYPILNIYKIESKNTFKNLVEPFFVPSLLYKIQHPHSFKGIPYRVVPRINAREETERTNSSFEDDATVQN